MQRAVIIGAGPGGLATALALRQAGVESVIYERMSVPGGRGSAFTLWPNAMAALEQIGVSEAVGSLCVPMAGIEMRSWRGDILSSTPRAVMEQRRSGMGGALLRAEL